MTRAALAALALAPWLALTAPAAWAEDEDGLGADKFTLEAVIDNDAEGGAALTVTGTAPGLPDGALVHITVAIKGKYTSPVEAAFFQVRVEDQRFAAGKAFANQRFAPELYWARAELFLSNQRKAVRDWIRRELGVSARAKLLLAKRDIEVGTLEEQVAFSREALTSLRRFVVAFQGLGAKVGEAIAGEPDAEGTAAARAAHREALEELNAELRAYLEPYVVWSDQKLIGNLQSARSEVIWSLSAYEDGRHTRARQALARTKTVFKRLLAEIDSRTPRREDEAAAEQPKPPEESETSGAEGGTE